MYQRATLVLSGDERAELLYLSLPKMHCARLAHTRATSVLANCQHRKFGAPSKRYH
jgi:hypothetical protein